MFGASDNPADLYECEIVETAGRLSCDLKDLTPEPTGGSADVLFSFGEEEFGVPDPELSFSDERQVTLAEITDISARFRYTYDFGDDWQHEITVEKLLDPDPDPDARYPALVDAKGACPPEDCGGPWGYANLREILADPSQDEHQDMLEWLGLDNATEFDPLAVPSEKIDDELALSSISG